MRPIASLSRRSCIEVGAPGELDQHDGGILLADRLHAGDPVDGSDGSLDGSGHKALDVLDAAPS